jgi:hypothetical protein
VPAISTMLLQDLIWNGWAQLKYPMEAGLEIGAEVHDSNDFAVHIDHGADRFTQNCCSDFAIVNFLHSQFSPRPHSAV